MLSLHRPLLRLAACLAGAAVFAGNHPAAYAQTNPITPEVSFRIHQVIILGDFVLRGCGLR